MELNDVIRVFDTHPTFAAHPAPFRHRVLSVLTEVGAVKTIPKGTALFNAGAPNDGRAFMLVRGSIEVRKPSQPVILCEAPDLLGEMGQINPMQKRMADVITDEDCIVVAFEWSSFWNHIKAMSDPPFAQEIEAFLGELAWNHLTE